jgi:hypothetical protein
MDKLAKYRQIVQDILGEYAAVRSPLVMFKPKRFSIEKTTDIK